MYERAPYEIIILSSIGRVALSGTQYLCISTYTYFNTSDNYKLIHSLLYQISLHVTIN